MEYSVCLQLSGNFAGYLTTVYRSSWKTKSIAVKHAKEFIAKFPEYTYTIEEN